MRAPRPSNGAPHQRERPLGHPHSVVGQDRLALVGREELQGGREVLEVKQRQAVVIAVLEDQREDRGLGLVEIEDLAHQQRAEGVDACAHLGTQLARQ